MQIRQHRLILNGVTTYVEDVGEGPPLVIVHGWAAGRLLWKGHQRAWREGHRVITYDLRGHGDAGKPEGEPYTIPQFAEDLLALCDALDLEQALILGHSMGGMVCQEFAMRHPGRVDRAVLSGTSLGQGDAGTPEAQDMLEMLRTGGYADFIEFGADMWFHTVVPQATLDLTMEAAKRCPEHVALAAMEGMLAWTARGRADAIAAPTLVLAGAEDATQPRENVEVLAAAIPHARLQWLPNLGHDCYLEGPAAYRAAVDAFFAEGD